MEDYIRGVLCGYLLVQNGTRDGSKRRRTFVVLSDSRMDYYLTDPRPTFSANISATYLFDASTQLHHYVELNTRAPPYSFCLTTDKTTDVYIAETEVEAQLWFRHISERLEALSTMLTGTLMVRKELPPTQQVKRFLVGTKYRWKARHVELGHSTLRFCKASQRKTRTMHQFTLTATSFAGQEATTYLRQLAYLASYAIPVDPTPKKLKKIAEREKQLRAEESAIEGVNPSLLSSSKIRRKGFQLSAFYPFVVSTGQAHLQLAAPTDQVRTHWILAIRLRIVSLKYRHNQSTADPRNELNQLITSGPEAYHLQGFVEVQIKPGGAWKQRYVELDGGMLRVKKNERRLGSIFETQLVPTSRVTTMLAKANAFTLRSLGREVAFGLNTIAEMQRWMETLTSAAASVDRTRCQRVFHDEVHSLLRCSVMYTLDVPADAQAGLVVEKHNKRIFVVNHEPVGEKRHKNISLSAIARRVSGMTIGSSSSATASPASSSPSSPGQPALLTAIAPTNDAAVIPQGSVLVGISQFAMLNDSFDSVWHALRQKKVSYKHPKQLLFRAPVMKAGLVRVKFRLADNWKLRSCRLANGRFQVESLASADEGDSSLLLELSLRHCEVDLVSDDDCANGIRLSVGGANGGLMHTAVLMNVQADDDAFLWYTLLHMEISVAQDSPAFPVTAEMLANVLTASSPPPADVLDESLAAEQSKKFRNCTVVGTRVEGIEKHAREQEAGMLAQAANELNGGGKAVDVAHEPSDLEQCSDSLTHEILSDEDVTLFFQHLDAVGSGKVSATGLIFTMHLLTRHIHSHQTKLHSSQSEEPTRKSITEDPLADFHAELHALNPEGRLSACLTPDEFARVMANVTHPAAVRLVRKAARNEIQCI